MLMIPHSRGGGLILYMINDMANVCDASSQYKNLTPMGAQIVEL